MKRPIYIITTSQFKYDQRLQKVARTLENDGHKVKVVDRSTGSYSGVVQTRFSKGVLMYLEFNARVFIHGFSFKKGILYVADIDPMPGVYLLSLVKSFRIVLDLHEWFPEVPELQGAPLKKRVWKWVERWSFRISDSVITVNESLSEIFRKKYSIKPVVLRNLPYSYVPDRPKNIGKSYSNKVLYYQGAVNKGRGLEVAIKALENLPDWRLWIVGDGDLLEKLKKMASRSGSGNRILFWGRKEPEELNAILAQSTLGLNLLGGDSDNYYYSLANKFFDYMLQGVPSINMNFPEYSNLIKKYRTGYLLEELSADKLAELILSIDFDKYRSTVDSALEAAQFFIWEKESQKLLTEIEKISEE